jgi:hypothetical protein
MRRPLRRLVPAALLLMGVLAPATTRATTMVARSVEDLSRASESIVRATTLSTRSAWDAQHRHIVTTVRLRALEKVAGRIEASTEFEVQQSGGIVDGIEEMVIGAPTFAPGEEVVLFLVRDPKKDGLTIAEMAQGKLEVMRDAAGRDHLGQRDLAGVDWVQGTGPNRVSNLATLRARVSAALRLAR